jgi:hypothetical protein
MTKLQVHYLIQFLDALYKSVMATLLFMATSSALLLLFASGQYVLAVGWLMAARAAA